PHANTAMRLAEAVVAVRDLDDAARRFALAYDLHPPAVQLFDASLGARVLDLSLDGGHERIRLAQPEGPGIAADRINAAGEGLFLIGVAVGDLQRTEEFLRGQAIPFSKSEEGLIIPAAAAGGASLRFVGAQ
ncbi:MAG TPA: hypothetical protein VGP82_21660, partial [Ktedonobacterales bacterium]|nr:hypothetical protein [Ktedonobacterales bacterium]